MDANKFIDELYTFIDYELVRCKNEETRLLGNNAIKDWKVQLNYWLGRRDIALGVLSRVDAFSASGDGREGSE
jgi:hypothetical protein